MNDNGTIKSTRWDYKIMKSFAPRYVEAVEFHGETICGWWGSVISNVFLAIITSLLVGGLSACAIIFPTVALFFNVDYLPEYAKVFYSIGLVVWIMAIIVPVYYYSPKLFSYIKANETTNEPGLIAQRYHAWKDKVCYNIKIVHVDKEN